MMKQPSRPLPDRESLKDFYRHINLDAEPILNAREAAPIINQVLAKGDVTAVTSPLCGRTIGHVVALGDWALFVASKLVPDGVSFRVTDDFRIRLVRKSTRQFAAVLIRRGQDRPSYAGDDFRFRNLH